MKSKHTIIRYPFTKIYVTIVYSLDTKIPTLGSSIGLRLTFSERKLAILLGADKLWFTLPCIN